MTVIWRDPPDKPVSSFLMMAIPGAACGWVLLTVVAPELFSRPGNYYLWFFMRGIAPWWLLFDAFALLFWRIPALFRSLANPGLRVAAGRYGISTGRLVGSFGAMLKLPALLTALGLLVLIPPGLPNGFLTGQSEEPTEIAVNPRWEGDEFVHDYVPARMLICEYFTWSGPRTRRGAVTDAHRSCDTLLASGPGRSSGTRMVTTAGLLMIAVVLVWPVLWSAWRTIPHARPHNPRRSARNQARGAKAQSSRDTGNGKAEAAGGKRPEWQTAYVFAHMDKATREMGGKVLKGRFAGRSFVSLSDTDLWELVDEAEDDGDTAGAQVVTEYLRRERHQMHRPGPSAAVDVLEAYSILGLKPGATVEEIKAKHRKLIADLHSDRGGSDWLAARINDARDVLLAAANKNNGSPH